eukprot:TRINITY_DN49961_c0_g1_i1.p1 TRINITY_DN49961_c0_g1~~TRINITY_DN49961_c0_g1_i1.p1  ORF type:complete len:324 (+),score=31.54 TRINITY_DN49961_c0_g1_i1:38-973(+)
MVSHRAFAVALLNTNIARGAAFNERAKNVYLIRHGTAEHNVRYNRKHVVFKSLIEQRIGKDGYSRWDFPEIEEWAYMTNETVDTSLVASGIAEAQALGAAWDRGAAFLHDRGGNTEVRVPLAMRDVDLVVTSPLTRTLQTMTHVFFEEQELRDGTKSYKPRWCNLAEEECQADVSTGACSAKRDTECRDVPILALDVLKEWSQGRHTPNKRKARSELVQKFPHVDFGHLDSELDTLWKERWPGDPNGLEPRAHLTKRVGLFKDWLAARPEKNVIVVGHGTFLGNLLFDTFIEDTVEMAHCKIYAYETTSAT